MRKDWGGKGQGPAEREMLPLGSGRRDKAQG